MGDQADLPKGPVFKNVNDLSKSDPMGDDALQFFRNRNLVK